MATIKRIQAANFPQLVIETVRHGVRAWRRQDGLLYRLHADRAPCDVLAVWHRNSVMTARGCE